MIPKNGNSTIVYRKIHFAFIRKTSDASNILLAVKLVILVVAVKSTQLFHKQIEKEALQVLRMNISCLQRTSAGKWTQIHASSIHSSAISYFNFT